MGVSVLSFNVNFGAAYDGFVSERETALSIEVLLRGRAEVCLLQEITPEWEVVLRNHAEVSKEYPFMLFQQKCGNWCAGGQGIISKYPIQSLEWSESICGWFPGWIANVEHPEFGIILLLNVHLRPPLPAGTGMPSIFEYFRSRTDREQDMRKWMGKLDSFHPGEDKLPIIVAGDFNEESTGKSGTFLRSLGLEDGVNQHDKSISWKWPLLNGWFSIWGRYDHIFYSLKDFQCISGKVFIGEGASDHYPVQIELHKKDSPHKQG